MITYILGVPGEMDLILTLNENQTTSEPLYNFSFTHVATSIQVTFILSTVDDKSFWPERYNLFKITPADLFTEPGEWHYKVTEQQTGVILEEGILLIEQQNNFSYTTYHAGNKGYTVYRG